MLLVEKPHSNCLGLPFIEEKDALPKGGIIVMRRFLLLPIIFLFFALTGWLYFGTNLKTIPDAFATGGAFPSTKHGGGTVDGIGCPPRCGVNRAFSNPDYPSGLYNVDNPEAGQYNPGECAHCHEPHASFGGYNVEPPPVTGSPSQYLLMKYGNAPETNYSYLCWYCHDNIVGGGGPRTGYWGFYQGGGLATDPYQQSSHYKSSNFYWPGAGANAGVGSTDDTVQTWPRKPRSSSGGNVGSCLNCHTPHGVSGTFDSGAPTGLPTANYLVGTASGLIPRQLIAREEALCLNCHDDSGPATAGGAFGAGTSVKSEVDKYLYITGGSATEGSGHPVRNSNYFGLHNLAGRDGLASTIGDNETSTATSGWLGTSAAQLPHAECVDCHNPHAAQGYGSGDTTYPRGIVFQQSGGITAYNTNRGGTNVTSNPVNIAKANIGVWGVNVTTTTGAISSTIPSLAFTTPAPTNYMYQLCLKCHSAWAWGAATGTASPWNAPSTTKTWTTAWVPANNKMTDVASEFAIPAAGEKAYHPVFGPGQNAPAAGLNSYWKSADSATSGDCGHRVDLGNGADDGILDTLNQTFVPPWRYNGYVTCVDCHEDDSESSARGPHGSARPFILRKLNTGISYNIYTDQVGGNTAITYSTFDGGSIATNDPYNFCLNCHRMDVYGGRGASTRPETVSTGSKTCYSAGSKTILTHKFSRQSHPVDGGSNSYDTITITDTRNGIACMICHGGRADKVGVIHGDSTTTTTNVAGGKQSARFIASDAITPTNHEWKSWVKGSTATAGSCIKTGGANKCGNTSENAMNAVANYDY